MAKEPALDRGGLVRRGVVEHHVNLEVCRQRVLDQVQEASELLGAMPRCHVGDHLDEPTVPLTHRVGITTQAGGDVLALLTGSCLPHPARRRTSHPPRSPADAAPTPRLALGRRGHARLQASAGASRLRLGDSGRVEDHQRQAPHQREGSPAQERTVSECHCPLKRGRTATHRRLVGYETHPCGFTPGAPSATTPSRIEASAKPLRPTLTPTPTAPFYAFPMNS